jgi:hypothetical protein
LASEIAGQILSQNIKIFQFLVISCYGYNGSIAVIIARSTIIVECTQSNEVKVNCQRSSLNIFYDFFEILIIASLSKDNIEIIDKIKKHPDKIAV